MTTQLNNGNWQDYNAKKLNWEAILYYVRVALVKCKRLLNNPLMRRRNITLFKNLEAKGGTI
jgi:hypothetical protein